MMVYFVADCNWLLFAGVSVSRIVPASAEDVTVTSVILQRIFGVIRGKWFGAIVFCRNLGGLIFAGHLCEC